MNKEVKIVFELQRDEDGYPPESWEGIWAEPLGDDRYKIDNIPFFARGVSCDDIVRALPVEGELRFQEVLEPSSNSTIRVIIYDLSQVETIRSRLRALGCDVEGSSIPGLIATNIPKDAFKAVMPFIEQGFKEDKWDYEESAIRAG